MTGHSALQVITVAAVIFTPLILLYQAGPTTCSESDSVASPEPPPMGRSVPAGVGTPVSRRGTLAECRPQSKAPMVRLRLALGTLGGVGRRRPAPQTPLPDPDSRAADRRCVYNYESCSARSGEPSRSLARLQRVGARSLAPSPKAGGGGAERGTVSPKAPSGAVRVITPHTPAGDSGSGYDTDNRVVTRKRLGGLVLTILSGSMHLSYRTTPNSRPRARLGS